MVAKRKPPAITYDTADGSAAATPFRHQASARARGSSIKCGNGSQTVPI
jgi:hypothetical protein